MRVCVNLTIFKAKTDVNMLYIYKLLKTVYVTRLNPALPKAFILRSFHQRPSYRGLSQKALINIHK